MKLPVFDDPVTGEPSFSFTVAAVTWTVVLTRWLVGGGTYFRHTFERGGVEEIGAWLTPTLLFYLGRQATKAAEFVATTKKGAP